MKRKVIITREHESATYRIEVFENDAPILRQDGRSYEFCLLAEHIEHEANSDVTWNHRGVEPKLDEDALRRGIAAEAARKAGA